MSPHYLVKHFGLLWQHMAFRWCLPIRWWRPSYLIAHIHNSATWPRTGIASPGEQFWVGFFLGRSVQRSRQAALAQVQRWSSTCWSSVNMFNRLTEDQVNSPVHDLVLDISSADCWFSPCSAVAVNQTAAGDAQNAGPASEVAFSTACHVRRRP